MNPSYSHELSPYQIINELSPKTSPLMVNFSIFQEIIQGLMNCCRGQAIKSTLWVKLPANPQWKVEIEQYYQEGLADRVYYCSIGGQEPSNDSFSFSFSSSGINQVVLEASTQLQREYFFLLLSPQFCSLTVIQEMAVSSQEESHLDKSLKLISTFVPEVINRVLQELKQMVTILDSTPEELIADAVLTFPFPQQIETPLLTSIFQNQLKYLVAPSVPIIPSPALDSKSKSIHELFASDDDFLMNMTREMRVPLTNMKTALRLLDSMQNKREQRQRYLDLLKRECDRQNLLITGLQEFIQLNHPLDEKDKTVRLEDSVPGIVSTYQAIAEEKGISLGYTIPAGFPAINCPNAWLRLIVHHLLHNSLKFTKAEGRIYVQSALKGQTIELVISDTGVGIDNSDIPHLFESFYRGRNATSPELAGAGLGLAIVKQLVQRCGASITVNSYLGKGTTFRILFPIAPV
jgi:signal transduction histidine kinase